MRKTLKTGRKGSSFMKKLFALDCERSLYYRKERRHDRDWTSRDSACTATIRTKFWQLYSHFYLFQFPLLLRNIYQLVLNRGSLPTYRSNSKVRDSFIMNFPVALIHSLSNLCALLWRILIRKLDISSLHWLHNKWPMRYKKLEN